MARGRAVWGLLIVIMLLAPTAAAASGTPRSSPESAQVTDPDGDAREWNSAMAATMLDQECYASSASFTDVQGHTPAQVCSGAMAMPSPSPDQGGVPAPRGLDITAANFRDTATTVEIDLVLSSLDEPTLTGALSDGRRTHYDVGWTSPDGHDVVAVAADPTVSSDGHPFAEGSYWNGTDACNDWWWCEGAVPTHFTFGSPGKISWSVPRVLLPADLREAGATFAHTTASVRVYDPRIMGPYSYQSGGLRGAGLPPTPRTTAARPGLGYYVDQAGPGTDFVLAVPRAPTEVPTTGQEFRVAKGNTESPADDILGCTLIETSTQLRVAVEVARVDAPADGFLLDVSLGMPDRHVAEFDADWLHGNATVSGGHYTDESGSQWAAFVPTFEVVRGAPGWYNFTVNRTDVGSPNAGEVLNLYTVGIFERNDSATMIAGKVGVAMRTQTYPDEILGPVLRFTLDTTTPPGADRTATFADPTGDAVPPPSAFQEPMSDFDIGRVAIEGTSPTGTRITMTLADLSNIQVPQGYDAAVYAVGVEVGGQPFMVGYYKPADASGQAPQFYCSLDTDVLVATKHSPKDTVMNPILGRLLSTVADTGSGGTGSHGGGSISFLVPHSCFGVEAPGPFTSDRLAAGTYLIPSKTPLGGTAFVVDEAAAPHPVTLGMAAAPLPLVPWWIAPFGFAPFWGVAALGLTLVGGAGLLAGRQRRRTILRRELRAIEEAHQKQRHDAPAWRAAMHGRRTRAGALLARGRLRPDELLVIERRIELLAGEVREAPPASPTLVAGALVADRYRIDHLLGTGGQGRAFLARDTMLDRSVVVKSLSMRGVEDTRKRLVLAEARVLAAIDHANVVRVLDVESIGDETLLILEYVDGGTLRAKITREKRLPPSVALPLFRQVLEGLRAAHARGVVHRDVKPENVLLTREGDVAKLADFGAAIEAQRADATFVPRANGTLHYLSPEQVRGLDADARSDMYAAGAMFYEMLAGECYLDLRGLDDLQIRSRIVERPPELRLPPDALALAGFLSRALAKEPADRFTNVSEMLASFDAIVR